MKIVLELPFYNSYIGGIRETVKLAEKMQPGAYLRFQRLMGEYPRLSVPWSVGMPDNTFPDCDVCITYSDNPYIDRLKKLKQVKKVVLLMLSYGMSLQNERKNILTPGITVCCSSQKIERAIMNEGIKVHRIGFDLDKTGLINKGYERKRYLALMYHPMPSKNYKLGVEIADDLLKSGDIDGVITFGITQEYKSHSHPQGLIAHYPNANRQIIVEIFNTCRCYLMPSISEGLNLTPFEATLCGCPSVIMDGAINEVYFDRSNCFVANDIEIIKARIVRCMNEFQGISPEFEKNMRDISGQHTIDSVIGKLKQVL